MTRTDPEWKDKIITGDETWVYDYNPETKRQYAEWRGQDIAPNDFFLFPKLKAVLKGRHFDTRDDIIEKSLLALKSIPKELYKKLFRQFGETMALPMDQGVIVAFKRLYKRRQLESCLVFSSDADQPNNSVGEQTFSNLKKYDIKKAIFNFGNYWDELKSSTIRNGWKILLEHKNNSDLETAGDALQLSEDESDEDEQEIRRLEQLFQRARIEEYQESINEWIDIDLDDPGHNVFSNDDIVEAVLSEKMEISSSDDSSSTSEDSLEPDVPRCEALKSLDVALKYLEKRTEPEMLASYNTINSLRTMLMREEEALLNKPKKQTTIRNFFAKP
ncbi:TIGD7 [Cordylochernes scorpioides]|uniref:TIGD7 n=1 Tax=Cordylochernes scorpioides TaxID=51811 RepID=A0ABY6K6Y7_9ARAC|nr:TIGD7 [Cordylochernes scorpioides]